MVNMMIIWGTLFSEKTISKLKHRDLICQEFNRISYCSIFFGVTTFYWVAGRKLRRMSIQISLVKKYQKGKPVGASSKLYPHDNRLWVNYSDLTSWPNPGIMITMGFVIGMIPRRSLIFQFSEL
jgi:hypothetical protein